MMNRYETTGLVIITGGVVELEEAQARPRMHMLKPLDDKQFEVMQTIQFKKGEVFGFDGKLKNLPVKLSNPEKPAKQKKAKPAE